MGYEFRILGPLECWYGESRLPVVGARQQRLVATLLLNAGQLVTSVRLVDVMWDENPPSTSRQQLFKVISALRRAWSEAGLTEVESVIETDGPGYRLNVAPDMVDAALFEQRVVQAGRLRQAGRAHETAATLRSALKLWRGPALAGLTGRVLEAATARLNERRLAVQEQCLALELELGRHQDVVAELGALVADHPFRERLVELLMLALYRSGRQTDALGLYHRLWARMTEDLGVEPSQYLRALHERMLRQDHSLDVQAAPRAAEPGAPALPGPPEPDGPSGLPEDARNFTGRAAPLLALDSLLNELTGPEPTAPVATVVGPAGVGKTALAVHWAHRVRHCFPDGQLYLNLRGASPLSPADALPELLAALGAAPEAVPADVAGQARLLRALLSGKRVLVLLDDAVSVDQLRPLLPSSRGCLALVTSRHALSRLAATREVRQIALDPLDEEESVLLLRQLLGPGRVRAEPRAVRELARMCGYLPLALRLVAADLVCRAYRDLADAVGRLTRRDRLADLLADGEAAVGAAFELTYQGLQAEGRTLVKAMSLAMGPDVTLEAAAVLLRAPTGQTAPLLAALETGHLIEQYRPGRYRLHEPIRRHALAMAEAEDQPEEHAATRIRLLAHYFSTACVAMGLLAPEPVWGRRSVTRTPGHAFATVTSAVEWLAEERANLVAALDWGRGLREVPAPLLAVLRRFSWMRRYLWQRLGGADWVAQLFRLLAGWVSTATLFLRPDEDDDPTVSLAVLRQALAAGDRNGDRELRTLALILLARNALRVARVEEAIACSNRAVEHAVGEAGRAHRAAATADLGTAYRELGELGRAERELTTALLANRDLDCAPGQAHCEFELALVRLEQGRLAEAAELCRVAHARAEESGAAETEAVALAGLAVASVGLRRPAEAVAASSAALALSRDSGTPGVEILALLGRSNALMSLGEAEAAVAMACEAVRVCVKHGFRLGEGRAHQMWAVALVATGEYHAAQARAERALSVHEETGQQRRIEVDRALLAEIASLIRGAELAEVPQARSTDCAQPAAELILGRDR